MTEWPVTTDRRYPGAVILGLDSMVTKPEKSRAQALDTTVPLLRRLPDDGVATAVYSSTRDCAKTLRAAGISELVSIGVDDTKTAGEANLPVLIEATTRLGISPGRCAIIACDRYKLANPRRGCARRMTRQWGPKALNRNANR